MERVMFCPACETEHEFRCEERTRRYRVRDEEVSFMAPAWVSSRCKGSPLEEAEGDPIERAYEIFRSKHGLLSPVEIRQIREQWALGQATFATLLGMSPATVNRYENGALHQRKEDELFRSCAEAGNLRGILTRRGHLLTGRQRAAVEKALRTREKAVEASFPVEPREVTSRSGFKGFEFDRYAAVVAWFCKEVQVVTQTKLYKLLFYADYLHFRANAVSLTGALYRKMPYGPVPVGFNELRSRLEAEDYVTVQERVYQNGNTGEEFALGPKAEAIPYRLVPEEERVLRFVRDRLGAMTPSKISDLSHAEKAWQDTPLKGIISYEKAVTLSLALPPGSKT